LQSKKLPSLFPPETQREEYMEFQRKLLDDDEESTYTEEVDDTYEMILLSKEQNNERILTPELIN